MRYRARCCGTDGLRAASFEALFAADWRDAYTENSMNYKVALWHTEEGYSVSCPGLPGCWSQGESEQQALDNITEAIREYLAAAADLNPDAEIREVTVPV